MKPKNKRILRTALIASLLTALLVCTAVFLGVGASEGDVSPSDLSPTVSGADAPIVIPEGELYTGHFDGMLTSNKTDFVFSKDTEFLKNARYQGNFRSELDDWEKQVYDAFYKQYVTNKKKPEEEFTITFNPPYQMELDYNETENGAMDISGIYDTLCSAYAAFYYDNPSAFWVGGFYYGHYWPSYTVGDEYAPLTQVFISCDQAYNGAYSERSAYSAGLNRAINTIRNTRASSSRYDTIVRIHDYVCENSVYNYDALSENLDMSVYGHAFTSAPLFTGRGTFVCEGYSKALKELCDAFDIPCACVAGGAYSSDGNYLGPHMWNYVKMDDGGWYAIDSTWDDRDDIGAIDYTYFLVGKYSCPDDDIMNPNFEYSHTPSGQVMMGGTYRSMVYPDLSEEKYVANQLAQPVFTEPYAKFPYPVYARGATLPLTWDPVPHATGYEVCIKKQGESGVYGGDITVVDEIITGTTYNFTPDDYSIPYRIGVKAVDNTNTYRASDYRWMHDDSRVYFGLQGDVTLTTVDSEEEGHVLLGEKTVFDYPDIVVLKWNYLQTPDWERSPTMFHLTLTRNGKPYMERDIDEEYLDNFFEHCEWDEEQNQYNYYYQRFVLRPGEYTAQITAINDNYGYETKTSNVVSFTVNGTPIYLSDYALFFTCSTRYPHPSYNLAIKEIEGEGGEIEWFSDDPEIASVDQTGLVTANKCGVTQIHVRFAGTDQVSRGCDVYVDDVRIVSENGRVSGNKGSYFTGEADTLLMGNMPPEETVWKSSNPSVVYIDSDGHITALKKGTVTITGVAFGYYKETASISVVQPTESFSLNTNFANVYVGKTVTFKGIMDKGANEPIFWSVADSSIASVTDKGVVKGLSQGTTTVTATTLSGKTASAEVVVRTMATAVRLLNEHPGMTVSKEIKYGIVRGQTLTLNMAITAPEGSNDTVTWTTSSAKAVTIDSVSSDGHSATVRGLTKGVATITAKTGSGKKVTAKVTVVDIPASQITLNKTTADIYTGASATLSAKASLPKGNNDVIYWKSSNPSVARVDENGKVTAVAQGSATVTAYSSQNSSVKADCAVTVRTKAQDVEWLETPEGLYVTTAIKRGIVRNETITLKMAIVSPQGSNDTVTWTTSNAKVVSIISISSDGHSATVSGLQKGAATITAKTGSGKKLTAAVTVVDIPADTITLNKTALDIYTGASVSLSAKAPLPKGNNDVIYWKSSNPSVARVDVNGKVTAVAQGTATVTAYSSQNSSVKADCAVLVRTKAQTVEWLETPEGLFVTTAIKRGIVRNETVTLKMAITAPQGSNDTVTWTTSNAKVVSIISISSDGHSATVTGLQKGTATVTARTGSGKALTASVTVVDIPADTITLNKTSIDFYVGASVSLSAKAPLPKGNNDVIYWKSSDPSVARVDVNGKVTAVAQGTATVTAYSSQNSSVKADCAVIVRTKAIQITWNVRGGENNYDPDVRPYTNLEYPVEVGREFYPQVQILDPEDCNDIITWKTSNSSVVRIDGVSEDYRTVYLSYLKPGKATITGRTGSGKTVTAKVTVIPAF